MSRKSRIVLFDNVLVNATGASSRQDTTAGAIDLRYVSRSLGVLIQAASVVGAADIKLEYRISHDGLAFGSFDDETDIIAASATDFSSNPEGWHTVDIAAFLSRYVDFRLEGVNANPADTLVTAYLLIEED